MCFNQNSCFNEESICYFSLPPNLCTKTRLITHWVCTEMLRQSRCGDEDHAGRIKFTPLVTGETVDPL